MNLRHLKIFEAIAEAGSIRAAARVAGLAQPAMTYAMRELEQSVGAQLLVRSAQGVSLTVIGEALLQRARLLANEVRRAEDEIAQLRDGAGGLLRVAFSSFAVERLLPDALQDFRRKWPGVALELQELSGADVKGLWSRGDFDFAILGELEPDAGDGVHRETLLEFPLAVVAGAKHPLARVRSMAKLHEAMWVVPWYGVELLRRHGVELNGAEVVVVGRGITVGRPLGLILTRRSENATVTLCHTGTRDLAAHTRRADVVVAAAGVPGMITADLIREGAVLVDVGVSRVEGKTVGDLAPDVWDKAAWVTPNPGGVGPMTRAMLLSNVVDLAEALHGR